jgi:hypothetical protein
VKPHSIGAINSLPLAEKLRTYQRFIPPELLSQFGIAQDYRDAHGRPLLRVACAPGSTDVVLELKHKHEASDPLLYAHLSDTVSGQIHVLLYVINDPTSPRFDVDRMPDGRATVFGTSLRNLEAETAAMQAGLAPGQVHRGLRILSRSIRSFEAFISSLGHDLYFVDPLYYHNAVIFERYGYAYQQGRQRMEHIHQGFQPGGDLIQRLDGSSPFRNLSMPPSIRGRSWAIHDGVLGEPYSGVIMYKQVGCAAAVDTFPGGIW